MAFFLRKLEGTCWFFPPLPIWFLSTAGSRLICDVHHCPSEAGNFEFRSPPSHPFLFAPFDFVPDLRFPSGINAPRSYRSEMKEDTVKLISAEGFEFIIDRKAALVSTTLRNMLTSSGSFTETQLGEVRFPDISTAVLEKVCQYFYWSLQYASGKRQNFTLNRKLLWS